MRGRPKLRPVYSLQGIFLQPIRTWARMVRLRKVRAIRVHLIVGRTLVRNRFA